MRVYLPDKEMREAIAWLNKCAQHQQDLINSTDSCSRPLVASRMELQSITQKHLYWRAPMTMYILDMQGGKPSVHISNDSVSPTITKGRASVNDIHVILRIKESTDERTYEQPHLLFRRWQMWKQLEDWDGWVWSADPNRGEQYYRYNVSSCHIKMHNTLSGWEYSGGDW